MGDKKHATQLKSSIDYRILGIIFALAILYQLAISQEDDEQFYLTDGLHLAGILICGIIGLIVSKRYRGSKVFGKAYFFLGLGFISWFIAESLWYYHVFVFEVDAYPAWYDPFYFAFYVLAVFHLVLNTRFFNPEWSKYSVAWLIGAPVIIVTSFTLFSYFSWGEYDQLHFDLFYGTIFVAGSSIVFSYALYGAAIFRKSILGSVWLLLAIGLLIMGIADFWYYLLEITEEYVVTHPVGTIWVLGFMIVAYSLILHKKTI